jgi:uncharacterized membrane protein (UPF0127 family)
MDKSSKMIKKVPAVGTKADKDVADDVEFEPPVPVVFKDDKGKVKCAAFIELADTPARRARGLSKRASLGKMSGMLFDCTGPFWMKDVEFPLDLLFTDEYGRITEKTAMAMDKEGDNLYPAHKYDSANAIELPFGFCDRHGVGVGDVVCAAELQGRR